MEKLKCNTNWEDIRSFVTEIFCLEFCRKLLKLSDTFEESLWTTFLEIPEQIAKGNKILLCMHTKCFLYELSLWLETCRTALNHTKRYETTTGRFFVRQLSIFRPRIRKLRTCVNSHYTKLYVTRFYCWNFYENLHEIHGRNIWNISDRRSVSIISSPARSRRKH